MRANPTQPTLNDIIAQEQRPYHTRPQMCDSGRDFGTDNQKRAQRALLDAVEDTFAQCGGWWQGDDSRALDL